MIALAFYIKRQEYRSEAAISQEPVLSDAYDEQMSQAMRALSPTFSKPEEDPSSLFRTGATRVMLGAPDDDLCERILHRSRIGYLYNVAPWNGEHGQDTGHYRDAIVRLRPVRGRSAILRMHYDEALGLFGGKSLDLLYLNGYGHDGESNGQLLRTWYAKLRPGSIVVGDGKSPTWPLVVNSIDDFVGRHGLEKHLVDCNQTGALPGLATWFAMRP